VAAKAKAPCGSRHKDFEEIVVQDLVLNPKVTRYRKPGKLPKRKFLLSKQITA
jgi:hypothetical protein